jgi:hypothetical protein
MPVPGIINVGIAAAWAANAGAATERSEEGVHVAAVRATLKPPRGIGETAATKALARLIGG